MRGPLSLLLALALVVAACGGPRSAADDELRAVASVFTLAWVAGQIAPGAGVTNLAGGGREAHDLGLTPAQRRDLEQADVVVYLGDIGFQPQIERTVASIAGDGAGQGGRRIVSVADVIGRERLRTLDGGHAAGHGGDTAGAARTEADAHADHDAGGTAGTGGAGHAGEAQHAGEAPGGRVDPHVWFDPALMVPVVHHVAEAFAATDPAGAAAYRSNAEQLAGRLTALDSELDELLSHCRFDTVFVSHEAYAYLLEPHGLRQEGVSGAAAHGEGSPQRIAELVGAIRASGVRAVLTEPVEGRTDAETLAREAGVDLLEIRSLDVVEDDAAGADYVELLRDQAEAVATAAACGEA